MAERKTLHTQLPTPQYSRRLSGAIYWAGGPTAIFQQELGACLLRESLPLSTVEETHKLQTRFDSR
ncbi:MAG: hypothetical protein EA383_15515 [Spirochaetaceae bacterium]|nr:MAG: hypothetical protein EA383_15515 [Spirochaetaceae bacterium]